MTFTDRKARLSQALHSSFLPLVRNQAIPKLLNQNQLSFKGKVLGGYCRCKGRKGMLSVESF